MMVAALVEALEVEVSAVTGEMANVEEWAGRKAEGLEEEDQQAVELRVAMAGMGAAMVEGWEVVEGLVEATTEGLEGLGVAQMVEECNEKATRSTVHLVCLVLTQHLILNPILNPILIPILIHRPILIQRHPKDILNCTNSHIFQQVAWQGRSEEEAAAMEVCLEVEAGED
ncbi:hypothetical protein AB1Y20_022389 [Prymnesium parvum]|uniref:Uncharacterized protein n=1 Tax=Prymnesium parvum TaxID=97485 RepID=A0AB34JHS8_PRYPA